MQTRVRTIQRWANRRAAAECQGWPNPARPRNLYAVRRLLQIAIPLGVLVVAWFSFRWYDEKRDKSELHDAVVFSRLLYEEADSVGYMLVAALTRDNDTAGIKNPIDRFWFTFDRLKEKGDEFPKVERYDRHASYHLHNASGAGADLASARLAAARYYRVCSELANLVTKPPEGITSGAFQDKIEQLKAEAVRLEVEARILTE